TAGQQLIGAPHVLPGVQLPLTMLSLVAAYWQFALAVMATRSSLGPAPLDHSRVLQVLGICAVLAIASSLAWIEPGSAGMQRLFMRVGLRYVLGAASYAW